jgi:hypothetical protein
MQELDELISTLAVATNSEANSAPEARSLDAIDRELAAPRRTSNIISLADSPEVNAFRSELIDGLIRVDTANQFLRLLNQVITQLL